MRIRDSNISLDQEGLPERNTYKNSKTVNYLTTRQNKFINKRRAKTQGKVRIRKKNLKNKLIKLRKKFLKSSNLIYKVLTRKNTKINKHKDNALGEIGE